MNKRENKPTPALSYLAIAIVVLVAGFLLLRKPHSRATDRSATASETSQATTSPTPQSHTPDTSTSRVAPNHQSEPPQASAITSEPSSFVASPNFSASAPPTQRRRGDDHEEQTFTNTDNSGRVTTMLARTADTVNSILDRLNGIDVASEYDSLGFLNFEHDESTMLMGYFRDPTTGLEIHLAYGNPEPGSGAPDQLSPLSCFYTKETGRVVKLSFDDRSLELKGDSNGYGILSVQNRLLIRMAYAMEPGPRSMIGRMYTQKNGSWKLARTFQAIELTKKEQDAQDLKCVVKPMKK